MQKAPIVNVFSRDLTMVCRIQAYTRLKFTRLWKASGEFELHVPYDPKLKPFLAKNNFIVLGEDGRKSGYIDDVIFTESSREEIVVKGFTLNHLTCRRINLRPSDPAIDAANYGYDPVPYASASGNAVLPVAAETVFKTYIDRHMVNPTDANRKIPGLVCAQDLRRGDRMLWLAEHGTVLEDTLCDVANYANMGFEIRLDIPAKRMVFDVVTGTNRTRGQADTLPVVFSSSFKNILSAAYALGNGKYKNVAYAVGEESTETGLRVLQAIARDSTMPTGLDRFEMSVDCGALAVVETSQAVSMEAKARQALSQMVATEQISCETLSTEQYMYGRDYDIGDLVTIEIPRFGVSIDQRITEVEELYENGKIKITPTCGLEKTARIRLLRSFKGGT